MQKHQEHKDLWQKNMGQKNEGGVDVPRRGRQPAVM